jgi:hypothetical protein
MGDVAFRKAGKSGKVRQPQAPPKTMIRIEMIDSCAPELGKLWGVPPYTKRVKFLITRILESKYSKD